MASAEYPFIDIAALDDVREQFAAGAPVVVLSTDLDSTIWANGPGAALFGHDDVESMIGADTGISDLARRQLAALAGFPEVGRNRPISIRLSRGLFSRAVPFHASEIVLPDGGAAIMLASAVPASARSPSAIARSAVSGITQTGHHAAYIGKDGEIVAATPEFETLGVSSETLKDLIREVRFEDDRMVKRKIKSGIGDMPAGIVRLTDSPAYHLLVVVDEPLIEEPASVPTAHRPAPAIANMNVAVEEKPVTTTAGHDISLPDTPADQPIPPFGRRKLPPKGAAIAENGNINGAGTTEPVVPKQTANMPPAPPIRFVWKTDETGTVTEISDNFVEAMGPATGDIRKRKFKDIANEYALDPKGEIERLMERRDTWSGRQVLWPLSDSASRIPVDLAALPIYDRARNFKGFRGFGVARLGEMVRTMTKDSGPSQETDVRPADTNDDGKTDTSAPLQESVAKDDPFQGEVPALSVSDTPKRRTADKVIDLSLRRTDDAKKVRGDTATEKLLDGLSEDERSAFREIADRLKKDVADAGNTSLAFGKRRPLKEKPKKKPVSGESEIRAAKGNEPEKRKTGGQETPAKTDRRPQAPEVHIRPNPEPSAFAGLGRIIRERQASKTLLATLPVPIVVYSDAGIQFANSAFFKFSGYDTIAELVQAGGIEAIFPDNPEGTVSTGDTGARSEFHLLTGSGRQIAVDARLHSIPWDGEKALVLSFDYPKPVAVHGDAPAVEAGLPVDAERAELENRIDELVNILDTATDGVVTLNTDATIRTVNRSAEALFGCEGAELAGKPFSTLFAVESQRTARDYLTSLSENGVASLLNDGREVIGREAQGGFIPLFMTIGKLPGSGGYCAVLRDITQWKMAEGELTEAKRIAEQSSSQKTEFLARISHEIRTPLNAIIGFSELMLDEKFGPISNERYRDYLGDINKSGTHVLDLVNDLLDISKIEAGELDLDYEAVALNEALSEAIAIIQPQANRERVIVRSSLSSGLPDVVADLRSVRQIALNLLSNAIRYTLAGGQVIVSTAYEDDGSVMLRVRDTGVGMSQVEINQALKPFKQIATLKRPHDKGTGLGLPLTKAMVEANRAKFSINSTPGEGTLVEIMFPPARVLAD